MAVESDSRAHWQLVRELRRVKQNSGLSFARLQARTPYSRSSLERYINGKLFPPRKAVDEIARACGANPGELLRIWDIAEAENQSVTPEVVGPEAGTPEPRSRKASRHWFPVAVVVGIVALLLGLADGDRYSPRASEGAVADAVPTAAPSEVWSRRLDIATMDDAKDGRLEVTLDWQGAGPFDGRIYGSVHARGMDERCAVAYAWLDGKVTTIGQACDPRTGGAVFGEFHGTWRALVQVCLRQGTGGDLRWCSGWS